MDAGQLAAELHLYQCKSELVAISLLSAGQLSIIEFEHDQTVNGIVMRYKVFRPTRKKEEYGDSEPLFASFGSLISITNSGSQSVQSLSESGLQTKVAFEKINIPSSLCPWKYSLALSHQYPVQFQIILLFFCIQDLALNSGQRASCVRRRLSSKHRETQLLVSSRLLYLLINAALLRILHIVRWQDSTFR